MRASFVRSRIIFFPLLIVFFFFNACTNNNNEAPQSESAAHKLLFAEETLPPFRSIMVNEAKELIKKQPDIVILDIRSSQELRQGTIEGSTQVPNWVIMQDKLKLPKDTPIMLLCYEGEKSFAAGHMLVKYGYKKVYNISGGLVAWKEAGFPVTY